MKLTRQREIVHMVKAFTIQSCSQLRVPEVQQVSIFIFLYNPNMKREIIMSCVRAYCQQCISVNCQSHQWPGVQDHKIGQETGHTFSPLSITELIASYGASVSSSVQKRTDNGFLLRVKHCLVTIHMS